MALVTGGARRIGAAIVNALHSAGYRLAIHCHASISEAHVLAKKLNEIRSNSAFVLEQELTQADAVKVIMTKVIDWAGRLDVLVNNASVFIRSELDGFNPENWERLFAINVGAPYQLSMAARPYLMKQQGSIINITDTHADKPLKGYAEYCQSKAALAMQTKALAQAFAPEIRVNSVAPGATVWPEFQNALSGLEQQKIMNKTLLKCHGHPNYIAQAVLSLVQNPFITGQTLKVDGGRD